MATYQPPTEDLIAFNSSVFKTANDSTLTLSEAQALFLGRVGTPTSTATATTFNGTLTTGTVNGVTLFTNASYGTKIGTGNSTSSTSTNCVLLGDNIEMGNSLSNTNLNVLVGSNISSSGQNLKQNVAVGTAIMKVAQNQMNNVCVGYFSCNGGGGSDTTAVGASSARNSTGGQNVAVGSSSLFANTTGTGNVAVGYNAFQTGATFTNSTAIGASTVIGASTSTAIGYAATTSVANSIVLGTATEFVSLPGTSATNGSLTTAADIYVNTLRAGVGKFQTDTNTCFGKDSLITSTSLGINNAAFGNSSLKLQSSGANCSAFGSGALATTTAEGNSGFGALAGNAISTGTKNTAVGSACLKLLSTGSNNTGVGNAAGQTVSTSSNNTLLGYLAGGSVTTGSLNTFVGSNSNVGSGGVVSSSALGAFSSVGVYSNSTAIGGGTSAVTPGAVCTASNQIMLGRTTETVECPGTVSSISLKTASNISVNGACIGIGSGGTNSLFTGLTVGTASGANNTLYGRGSYSSATDGSSSGNTIIGAGSSNPTYAIMVNHTVVGYGAGGSASVLGQNNITCIGAGATVINSVANSSAIGYNAQATLANQIMLGTSTEFVECSGTDTTNGCLKLNGGLKLQTSYGATPSATMLGYQLTNTTGFAIASFTSGSPTNISSAGISLTAGVWNIDYSIELGIATSTATVSAQTLFCSLTSNGVYATQRISNSGISRIHSTNTYLVADTPCFSGSFNYYVSSATTVYPIFQITYTAGPTISGTGFYRATRIG